MTRDEAIAALAQVLGDRLNDIGVEALRHPRAALTATPVALARVAVEWCESVGVWFEPATDSPDAEE